MTTQTKRTVAEGSMRDLTPDERIPRPITVYAFINSGAGTDWVCGMAMDEDGNCVAQHVSSTDAFAMHDMGATDAKAMHYHEYVARYGEGNFVVEWVDDVKGHEGLMAAYAKNQAMREETPDA